MAARVAGSLLFCEENAMRKGRQAAGGWILSICILLCLTSLAIYIAGTWPRLMLFCMQRDAPPESTGLPEDAYPQVAEAITGCLRGCGETFQVIYEDGNGTRYKLFHDYESQHMADCQRLFQWDRTLLEMTALISICGLIYAAKTRAKAFLSGMRHGVLFCACVLGSLLLWGLTDFDGLFVTFHRVAFQNMLWILNPETDLLIRLMPFPFFVHLVTGIVLFVGSLFGVYMGILFGIWSKKQQKEHTS